ncbi:capsule polysaccharide export protein KpsE/RkpR [Sphaerotilus hippei]|uniref:Capsule polysaccharide export protein KpsE/RkpR n=1 Tax=Sphaerotilus hippei TaxID=744406 RepID=A0A318H1Y7_9BURK|nr:Wzz/FepE/Etk N-terminal domain-containing protein [Sphaerotilus hippei]PXW97062.1 capsule polysaccharide export protein KpsE/RkpR [Sphaerotilus hippei]
MSNSNNGRADQDWDGEDDGISLGELASMIGAQWKTIAVGTVLAGVVGYGVALMLPSIYTARTVIMPPQQQQNAAAAALSSLGALAGLAGGGVKSPADQYIALMQSATVSDRLIDRFKLMEVYAAKFRVDARKTLVKNAQISSGKKDGLLTVEVDDTDPKRAADIANAYVDELRFMTNTLAMSEAQQRRKFFEGKLEETKAKLTQAQIELQSSGFTSGALRAEPKAAAEGYARARAGLTAAEVKLQTLRGMLADGTPEIGQQQALVAALRAEVSKLEQKEPGRDADSGYVNRYRDFKYQETLFELYAKQFELARMDESREGALIQVVDAATPPERRSKPMRFIIAIGIATAAFVLLGVRSVWGGMRRLATG